MPTPSAPISPTVKIDGFHRRVKYMGDRNRLSCCGIEELIWESALARLVNSKLPDAKKWNANETELAKAATIVTDAQLRSMIRGSVAGIADNRVLITGIPVSVGGSSQYKTLMPLYAKLREILPEFGFVQVGEPYKNKNSSNTIVIFVGKIG